MFKRGRIGCTRGYLLMLVWASLGNFEDASIGQLLVLFPLNLARRKGIILLAQVVDPAA